MKVRIALTSVALAAATAAGIGACSSASSSTPQAKPSSTNVGVPTGDAGVKPGPELKPPLTSDAQEQFASWALASGFKSLAEIQKDSSNLQAAVNAQDLPALERDGGKLSSDATVAASDPPPVDAADYVTAMHDLAAAGAELKTGQSTGVVTLLNDATAKIENFGSILSADTPAS
jgi:hypothetical protein